MRNHIKLFENFDTSEAYNINNLRIGQQITYQGKKRRVLGFGKNDSVILSAGLNPNSEGESIRVSIEDLNSKNKLQEKVDPKSTEAEIIKTLKPFIDKMRSTFYMPEYQKDNSDQEVLGVIASKYLGWDPQRIKDMAIAAFEDSNDTEAVQKMQDV